MAASGAETRLNGLGTRWQTLGLGDRAICFALLAVTATLNSQAADIVASLYVHGALGAIASLLGINAIIWFALFAVARIALDGDVARPLQRGDAAVLTAMFLAVLLPFAAASSLAVFASGLWLWLTADAGSRLRRMAIVLLALSGTLVWGRVLLALFGDQLLAIDGQFVALISGTQATANVVDFVDGTQFVIASKCSSLHNMSLSFVIWASLTHLLEVPMTRRLFGFALFSAAMMVLINGIRLAVMAHYPAQFDELHYGLAADLFSWTALLIAMLIAMWGVYDAAHRRI
ncbi:MAG: hypothetical protein AABZ45_07460 [Pseudomonadota bacterium]